MTSDPSAHREHTRRICVVVWEALQAARFTGDEAALWHTGQAQLIQSVGKLLIQKGPLASAALPGERFLGAAGGEIAAYSSSDC